MSPIKQTTHLALYYTRPGSKRGRKKNMPIYSCLARRYTSFTSTDKLCEAAGAWQNIYLLGRWNLCIETDNLPSDLHHLSFTRVGYPSTNIDELILASAKNGNVPFEHNVLCIVGFRGRQVNSLSLLKQ